jgi:hypothetical protein
MTTIELETNLANALADYENAHRVWMNTSFFSPAAFTVRQALDASRERYLQAVRQTHPNWIVM